MEYRKLRNVLLTAGVMNPLVSGCFLVNTPGPCDRDLGEVGAGVGTGVAGRLKLHTMAGAGCVEGTVRHLPVTGRPASDAEAQAIYSANSNSVTSRAENGSWVATLAAGDWLVCLDDVTGGVNPRCLFINIPAGTVRHIDGQGDDAGVSLESDDPNEAGFDF